MRRGSLALTAISVAAALRSFRAPRELDARLTPPPVSFENGEDPAQTSDPRGRGVRGLVIKETQRCTSAGTEILRTEVEVIHG